MKTTFYLSEQEFIDAIRLSSRSFMLAAVLAILLLFVTIASFVSVLFYDKAIFVVTVIFIFGAVYVGFIHPYTWKRAYRQNPVLHSQATIELADGTLIMITCNDTVSTHMKNIVKWRQNESFILYYIAPKQFFIVPKRIKSQGFDIDHLLSLLEKNLGKQQNNIV